MKQLFTTLFVISIFIAPTTSNAQSHVKVDATGEVRIPADKVDLRIQITVTETTPSLAFEEHKRQERLLSEQIRESGLEEQLLSFQPMSISGRQTRDSRQYVTSQSVHLQLVDFPLFEELQLKLIEHGFEQFSGTFGSTQIESAKKRALDLAIKNGREKAMQIARGVDKALGDIQSVDHTTQRVEWPGEVRLAEMRSDMGSMMDFDTTIPVTSSVTIVYGLK